MLVVSTNLCHALRGRWVRQHLETNDGEGKTLGQLPEVTVEDTTIKVSDVQVNQ